MEPTQTTPESESIAGATKKGTSGVTIAIIAVVVLALLSAGYVYMSNKNGGEGLFGGSAREREAVARVNGEAITRSEYDENMESLRANLETQGADLTNTELQAQMSEQVINSLIETELLAQAAAKNNFAAEDAEVQSEFDAIATQLGGMEALQNQMASVGLSENELRTNIKEQLAIREYLLATIDSTALTVSEEEITAFYASVDLPEGELPALEEVREQIVAQLQSQKEQAAIAVLLTQLRSEATVEVLI